MTRRLVGLCMSCEKPISNRRKDRSSTLAYVGNWKWVSELCADCEAYAKAHNGALCYSDEKIAQLAEANGMPVEAYTAWLRSQRAKA